MMALIEGSHSTRTPVRGGQWVVVVGGGESIRGLGWEIGKSPLTALGMVVELLNCTVYGVV